MCEKLSCRDIARSVKDLLIDSLVVPHNIDVKHPRKSDGHIPLGKDSCAAGVVVIIQLDAKLF